MEWKAIAGYEGYYEVSDTGLVRSLDRYITESTGVVHFLHGALMKQSERINRKRKEGGYMVVSLHKNHTSKVVPVHKLVADAFLPNPNSYPTINHIDGNKLNNRRDNLEWASYSRNNQHALDMGIKTAQRNSCCTN